MVPTRDSQTHIHNDFEKSKDEVRQNRAQSLHLRTKHHRITAGHSGQTKMETRPVQAGKHYISRSPWRPHSAQ